MIECLIGLAAGVGIFVLTGDALPAISGPMAVVVLLALADELAAAITATDWRPVRGVVVKSVFCAVAFFLEREVGIEISVYVGAIFLWSAYARMTWPKRMATGVNL